MQLEEDSRAHTTASINGHVNPLLNVYANDNATPIHCAPAHLALLEKNRRHVHILWTGFVSSLRSLQVKIL